MNVAQALARHGLRLPADYAPEEYHRDLSALVAARFAVLKQCRVCLREFPVAEYRDGRHVCLSCEADAAAARRRVP